MAQFPSSPPNQPPRWADRFLEWYCARDLLDEIQGDLHETFYENLEQNGLFWANLLFLTDVIRFCRPASFPPIHFDYLPTMFHNYFTTAVRNFWRQKGYTLINISGLSVGLACSILILLWVQDEMQVDQFHKEGDRIYRVLRHVSFSDGEIYTWGAQPMPLAAALELEVPEIVDAELTTWSNEYLIKLGDQTFREKGRHVDSAFFSMFTFPLIQGDRETVLDDPGSVAISESAAIKYFGKDWQQGAGILGKTLELNNEREVIISGVFEDIPENSTLKFDIALPIAAFISTRDWLSHWGNSSLQLYVRLTEQADLLAVNEKIAGMIDKNHEAANAQVFLHPYADQYLYSKFEQGKLVGGRIDYVRIFSIVALFILVIAAINFMNLATARSSKRAREIGVRKAVGASKGAVFQQFMGESFILSFISMGLAVLMVELLLPVFNELMDKSISVSYLDPLYLLTLIGIALITGFLAGVYPALMLSSFKVVNVLKGTLTYNLKGAVLRKGLVVFQFTLSILLIIGTLTIFQQISYIRTKNLGLDKDNLIFMNFEGKAREQYEAFRAELLKQPGIVNVTTSSQDPLSVGNSTSDPSWEGKDPNSQLLFSIINANYDFVETMQMELIKGRSHSPDFSTDTANYIINEVMADIMGKANPIGANLEFWGDKGQVIGIVKDFHFASLYSDIDPLIIRLDEEETWMLFVKLESEKTKEALAGLEQVYRQFNPDYPFDYTFLDENFEATYESEFRTGKLANVFAIMAIFISCLGLFGLASFTAERRTREIGIRKVLGASVSNLVMLLSRDFTWLVLIAFAFAAILAYFAMESWLSTFEYRIDMSGWVFALAGISAILISWLTIGYQSVKTALSNPVESLRTE